MRKKKEKDVRLSEKELNKLKSGMSRSERKEFEKRQKKAEEDRFWNEIMFAATFMDDD
ncbi:MAG: hypothetical protein LUE29_00310 [Lachnospiraceae bacterium]|nr:hypothetical protein [Lachnospiraceae bacterium]